jgi:hypothetical protein
MTIPDRSGGFANRKSARWRVQLPAVHSGRGPSLEPPRTSRPVPLSSPEANWH